MTHCFIFITAHCQVLSYLCGDKQRNKMTSVILLACVAFGFAAAAPNQLGEIGNLLGGIGPVLGGNDLDLGAGKTNPVS